MKLCLCRNRLAARAPQRVGTAFTLLEMVMAAAAAAVILVAIYGVFGRALRLRDDATERTREGRLRAHAASVIRNDLRNALISGSTGTALAATLEGSQQGKDAGFPGYLKFIATTARETEQGVLPGDLQQVEYYVAKDAESADAGAGVLVRALDTNLLAPVKETPREERLLTGVKSMEVTFYDGQSWTDAWTYSETETMLPEAIRVRIMPTAGGAPIEVVTPWTTAAGAAP